MIARSIFDFLFVPADSLEEMLTGYHDKLCSLSMSYYSFPLEKLKNCFESKKKLLELEQKKEDITKGTTELESHIASKESERAAYIEEYKKIKRRIAELRHKIVEARRGRAMIWSDWRIRRWEEIIQTDLEPELKSLEKRIRDVEKEIEEGRELYQKPKELEVGINDLKYDMSRNSENEAFWQETITEETYERVKKMWQTQPQSLNEPLIKLLAMIKHRNAVKHLINNRIDFIGDWAPLILSEKKYPKMYLGYAAMEEINTDPMYEKLEGLGIAFSYHIFHIPVPKYTSEISFYWIIPGVEPEDIIDITMLKGNYIVCGEKNREIVEKTLHAFCYGEKKWTEINPSWNDEWTDISYKRR